MALRSKARSQRGATQRRKLVWARMTALDVDIAAAAASFTNVLATFETSYGAGLIGCTIIRVRGMIYPGSQVDGLVSVAGLRIMNEAEFAGLTAASGPGTDLHADWMYWQAIPSANDGLEFDVRSQRKLDELGQGLLFSVSALSGAVVDMDFALSVLVALP